MQAHLVHHSRFYASLFLGVGVWAVMEWRDSPLALMLAGDSFYACYLVLTARLALRATTDDLRRRASYEDEGMALIFLLTLGAIGLSLAAILLLLAQQGHQDPTRLGFAIASLPLGWLTLHTILAFRYAHLYYAPHASGHAYGLAFPATEEPGTWDFLYFSFVVGMTGQVSDVQVMTVAMRRLTLAHGIVSFFFNTVILALTVNIAAGWSG